MKIIYGLLFLLNPLCTATKTSKPVKYVTTKPENNSAGLKGLTYLKVKANPAHTIKSLTASPV